MILKFAKSEYVDGYVLNLACDRCMKEMDGVVVGKVRHYRKEFPVNICNECAIEMFRKEQKNG